jgi:hypothetical protein
MRTLLVGSSLASAVAAIALVGACSLTTDLGGLSGGADPADGASALPSPESGPPLDGATSSDAPADTGSAGAYAAAVLADGPVAYYRFEDSSDSNFAKDEVGAHPANVTAKGATFGGDGVAGHAVTFDGNAALDVGDVFDFAGKQPFSLELWVKATTSKRDGQLLHKRDESVANDFKGCVLYLGGGGEPHFEAWGVDMSAWSDDPLPADFAHVVLVVSYATGKGNATLYVNAQPATHGGFDNVLDLADTPQHLEIGRTFTGLVDEAAIYAKALPPDRILAHYRAGKP